jgi:hypothetical protein
MIKIISRRMKLQDKAAGKPLALLVTRKGRQEAPHQVRSEQYWRLPVPPPPRNTTHLGGDKSRRISHIASAKATPPVGANPATAP